MANYIGSKCIVCENLFEKDDDIVVCPECGTPYHRSCYAVEGKCLNKTLHESKMSWEYDTISSDSDSQIICRSCGEHNKAYTMFCSKCGNPLIKIAESPQEQPNIIGSNPFNFETVKLNFDDPLCGYNSEEEYDNGNVKLKEISNTVKSNTHYYLPIFKRFKESGKNFFPNLIAFIFPEYYYAYRKMYFPMAVMILVRVVNTVINLIYFVSTGTNQMFSSQVITDIFEKYQILIESIGNVFYFIQMLLSIMSGIFANLLYYKHVISLVKKVKERNSELPEKELNEVLQKAGGTSQVSLILLVTLELIGYFALIFTTISL